MITKQEAEYTLGLGDAQCGGCVMFRSGSCDLVVGLIEPYAVCMYYEPNPGDLNSVAQHLAGRGPDVQNGL